MIPARFDYVRAETAEHAVAVLAEHGDEAKLMAGGHSLLPLMKLRLATPSVIIDVGRLSELSYIRQESDHVSIGALTRHSALAGSPVLQREVPLLAHAASFVGDPQVRNRGTLGGTLAHGDPASDLPAVALALGAELVVEGPRGQRVVPIERFYRGFLETALEDDELLSEVRVPRAPDSGWSFQKFTRRAQDWAIVGCAIMRGRRTTVALVNMGMTPLRAHPVEDAVSAGTDDQEAAQLAAAGLEPPSDLNGTAVYRTHLAQVLVHRGLNEAARRRAPLR